MANRRWGVIDAPGTQVTELESPPRITDKRLGTSVFIGLTAKGEYNKPVVVTSWTDFLQKFGNPVKWSLLPEVVRGILMKQGEQVEQLL